MQPPRLTPDPLQAPPHGDHPQCMIHTHICEGGLVTTIYRCGPSAPPSDTRFPQLYPDAPPTSRRHRPPKGLQPPPRSSVPHLPSLSSREPAEPHWSCHLHPTSPVSPVRRRGIRRVHSPTSTTISPSPAALAAHESADLQLPPSFPLYSQFSGTFFSPDLRETADTASIDDRMDLIRLSTSTLLAQVQAEMDAAQTISDVHAYDVDVSTSGTDWHVDVQLRMTPRSLGASPRGVPAGAPSCHTTLPRVDEHETVSSSEAPRPSVARRLDFGKCSPAAARMLGAEAVAIPLGSLAAAADGGEAAEAGKPDAAGRPVVPLLYPKTPTGRFQSYLQQLRDDRPSLEARTATTCTAVDSTATITPRDTERGAGVAAAPLPAAPAAPALLREEEEESDCSRTVERPRSAGAVERALCSANPAEGPDDFDAMGRADCSAWSLEDDTSDVDVMTTRTVSERSLHTSPATGSLAPPPLGHEPRMLWRRGPAAAW